MRAQSLQWILWAVGLALQYLAVAAMSGSHWRRYFVAFIYVLVLLTTTLTDIGAYLLLTRSRQWALYYWSAEVVRQSAMFAVVVDLAVRFFGQYRAQRLAAWFVVGGGVLYWTGSVIWLHQADTNAWMTGVVRNLSFGAAVANLALWFRLISLPERDPRDLAIAGGLGLQVTGEAIGQSLRTLYPEAWFFGNLIIVLAHYLCMIVWWQTFVRASRAQRSLEPILNTRNPGGFSSAGTHCATPGER